jgi:ureidoglycolate hydrolase
MNNSIEVCEYHERGFKPQVDCNDWRVALLNSSDMYLPVNVSYFDRHLLTDEVFILLSGSVGILTAGQDEKPKDTQCLWMEQNKVYNIKKNTWHTLYMLPGSQLAVIENNNTCIGNSPRFYFAEEEKTCLLPEIKIT